MRDFFANSDSARSTAVRILPKILPTSASVHSYAGAARLLTRRKDAKTFRDRCSPRRRNLSLLLSPTGAGLRPRVPICPEAGGCPGAPSGPLAGGRWCGRLRRNRAAHGVRLGIQSRNVLAHNCPSLNSLFVFWSGMDTPYIGHRFWFSNSFSVRFPYYFYVIALAAREPLR